ncbi:hypothetical protein Tsubulata_038679 [Turnera subulata]|uniref:Uncharacterized protein n=1 Tax=Turnera subulata TaxID=218843 RepID=A0A9Q0JL71_9ROSI|nr:hypothetical protein Tsubulata_038679 [Turnera subulata]
MPHPPPVGATTHPTVAIPVDGPAPAQEAAEQGNSPTGQGLDTDSVTNPAPPDAPMTDPATDRIRSPSQPAPRPDQPQQPLPQLTAPATPLTIAAANSTLHPPGTNDYGERGVDGVLLLPASANPHWRHHTRPCDVP